MSMDVIRTGIAAKKRRTRWLAGGAVAAVLALVTVGVASLDPALPSVDRDTVWIGTVERGTLVRQVRGHGTLVPEELRWIQAETAGRVDAIKVAPGDRVTARQVLLELRDPEVERAAVDAESALRRADAELDSLRLKLESGELDRRAAAAEVEADYVRATLQAQADHELFAKGLISEIQLKSSVALAEAFTTRREIETKRLTVSADSDRAIVKAKKAELEQQRALERLRTEQLEALTVRATIDGVVQEVPVEIGQRVSAGTMLARIAEPDRLQAEIKVPATRARDVRSGLSVSVDTRNGLVEGVVARIDPSVREGTVTVDVRLLGTLPEGARPDLAVDGTIQIDSLPNVLYVGRPVQSQENETVGLYRLSPDGDHAARVQVALGRSSVDTVEVLSGLAEGDRVILSDTSRWDDSDRIRLK
jgi:HlyD family secretion protein